MGQSMQNGAVLNNNLTKCMFIVMCTLVQSMCLLLTCVVNVWITSVPRHYKNMYVTGV